MRAASRLAAMAAIAVAGIGAQSMQQMNQQPAALPSRRPQQQTASAEVSPSAWSNRWRGMAYGTKVRGNMPVRRASVKARNKAKHRAACRGRK